MSQVGLKLPVLLRMTLNFRSSGLHLHSAVIQGVQYQAFEHAGRALYHIPPAPAPVPQAPNAGEAARVSAAISSISEPWEKVSSWVASEQTHFSQILTLENNRLNWSSIQTQTKGFKQSTQVRAKEDIRLGNKRPELSFSMPFTLAN